ISRRARRRHRASITFQSPRRWSSGSKAMSELKFANHYTWGNKEETACLIGGPFFLALAIERIARRANRADQVGTRAGVERLAQPADMDVYRSRINLGVVAPDGFKQAFAREHTTRMLQEMLEQPELRRAKRDGVASPANAVPRDVHFDVRVTELLAGECRADRTQHRADASDQLARTERLRHIIVGAGLEPADPVAFLAARGEHHDRHVGRSRPAAQAAADFDPADTYDHPVE